MRDFARRSSGLSSRLVVVRANKTLAEGAGGQTVRPTIQTSEERPMDFTMSERQNEWLDRVQSS